LIALAVPFGLLIGLAVGALGAGGSVLAVPVLVYLLDESVATATTTSLLVVAAGALVGGLGHAREGRVCWRHAGSFTAAAIPGIVLGTLAGEQVSSGLLLGGFALVMVLAAIATWRRAGEGEEGGGDWEPGSACPPLRLPRDLVAGALVGFVTGFFGVGGGFLIVPTLAVALAFTIRTAVGTSLAIVTATSLIAFLAHIVSGRSLDAGVAIAMTLACAAGASGGVAIAGRVPQPVLGRAFAVLLVLLAGYLAISAATGAPA
jgi:uncharacterized membrane protein YfcA